MRTLCGSNTELGYRLPETGRLVDDRGRPLVLPASDSGRTVTRLEERGEEIGVLVHDDALLADPALIDSVAAAAQLALATARLQAEARARAADVELSRRRIVESADARGCDLESELRAGPERLLERSLARLGEARDGAPDGAARRCARGRTPGGARRAARVCQGSGRTAQERGGLMPALSLLAAQVPLEVEIDGTVARLPEPIEATLYFVCSEALANAVKRTRVPRRHSGAPCDRGDRRRRCRRRRRRCEPRRRTRSARPADRVEALGGRLTVESLPTGGTRVRADLPLPVSGPDPQGRVADKALSSAIALNVNRPRYMLHVHSETDPRRTPTPLAKTRRAMLPCTM